MCPAPIRSLGQGVCRSVGWKGAPHPHSTDPEPPAVLDPLSAHPWIDPGLRPPSLLCLGSLHMGLSFPGSFQRPRPGLPGSDWGEG